MVDCQIHTSGVINDKILEAFSTIPREKFVPANVQSVAYKDEDLALPDNRFLLEPPVHARMLQALELQDNCVVLDIGGASGYPAAILSSMVTTVVAIEDNKAIVDYATQLWQDLECCNVAGLVGKLKEGNPEHAPYDAIILNGAVAEIPETLLKQLADGGRLIAVVKKPGHVMGDVTLVRNSGGSFSSYRLFSAGSPYLEGFAPKAEFQF